MIFIHYLFIIHDIHSLFTIFIHPPQYLFIIYSLFMKICLLFAIFVNYLFIIHHIHLLSVCYLCFFMHYSQLTFIIHDIHSLFIHYSFNIDQIHLF